VTTCPISHNWRNDTFALEIFSGISFIKRLEPGSGTKGGGKRGKVSNFTKNSRKRLLQKMACFRNMDAGYFATFTYPGHFTYSSEDCKSHLALFRKRLLYLLPDARVIWRMEVKKRLSGESFDEPVPHFHLLIFGLPYGHESEYQATFARWWNDIANNQRHINANLRCDVSQIRSRKQAIFYASKYAAKIDDGLDSTFGRHWGIFGVWDESMSMSINMTMREMLQLKRLIRAWMRSRGKDSIAKLFAGIREDFGIAVFGLGDHDNPNADRCTIIDMIIGIQAETR